MGAHLEKLRDHLRANMSMIDEKIQALKTKTQGKTAEAEQAIRHHLDSVQKKIDQNAAAVEAAKTKVDEWTKTQNAEAKKKIAEWKAKGDAKSLQAHADLADAYAKAMSVIASSAVDKAVRAELEAWLAHCDIEASKLTEHAR
jgi:chromosome segregation ATPase